MNAPNLRTADTPSSEADRNISSIGGVDDWYQRLRCRGAERAEAREAEYRNHVRDEVF